MDWDTVSTVVEVLSLLFAVLMFFMEWPRFHARLQESAAVKVIWNVAVPVVILVMAVGSYFALLVFLGALRTQNPLPPSTGKTIGYIFLSALLLGQLFLARVKTGPESQKFVKHAYITMAMIILLAGLSYFSTFLIL